MPHTDATNDLAFNLVARWEDEGARGNAVPLEVVCVGHTELLPQVREIVRRLSAVAALFPEETGRRTSCSDDACPPGWTEIGQGASSRVYRGEDTTFGTTVAFKVLHIKDRLLSAADVVQQMKRFEQEARILAQLKHDGIVRIFKTFGLGGRPVLEMEYLPGGSLLTHLDAVRSRGAKGIAQFVERVARATAFAHENNIVHRDLKPSNILLDAAGRPCVSDFGVAKLLQSHGDDGRAVDPAGDTESDGGGLTAFGRQPGTKAYMAPEQFDPAFGPISPATDVWALGVILYEIVHGSRPFVGGNAAEWAEAVCRGPLPRRKFGVWQSKRRLEAIALRCLARVPTKRYRTAAAVADALARAARRKSRMAAVAAGAILVTTVAALLALMLPAFYLGGKPPDWDENRFRDATVAAVTELSAGREAELIGPTGLPPHRWAAGGGQVRWRLAADGTGELVVSTQEPSLLELLPTSGGDAFSLTVSLRQEECYNTFAAAGVYVGRAPFTTTEGRQNTFARLEFADLGKMAVSFADGAGRPSSRADLDWVLFGESSVRPYRLLTAPARSRQLHYMAPAPFGAPGPLRRLFVAVSRGRVSATCPWAGDGELRLDAAAAAARRLVGPMLAQNPDLRAAQAQVPWQASGGIGLYVYGCQVAVSGFAVRPLADP